MRSFFCLLAAISFGSAVSEARAQGKTPLFTLDMPTPEQLFRVKSEAHIRAELSEAGKKRGEKVQFPPEPEIKAAIDQQPTPFQVMTLPTGRVCFRTLYFQDVRAERDMRSCGVLEPLREVAIFYGTAFTSPILCVLTPPWRYQCWDHSSLAP